MSAGLWRYGRNAIWKQYRGRFPADPVEQDRVLAAYRVSRYDVEDAINELLGARPLLSLPFEFELSPELVAVLES
jgi:hypothetical protein